MPRRSSGRDPAAVRGVRRQRSVMYACNLNFLCTSCGGWGFAVIDSAGGQTRLHVCTSCCCKSSRLCVPLPQHHRGSMQITNPLYKISGVSGKRAGVAGARAGRRAAHARGGARASRAGGAVRCAGRAGGPGPPAPGRAGGRAAAAAGPRGAQLGGRGRKRRSGRRRFRGAGQRVLPQFSLQFHAVSCKQMHGRSQANAVKGCLQYCMTARESTSSLAHLAGALVLGLGTLG